MKTLFILLALIQTVAFADTHFEMNVTGSAKVVHISFETVEQHSSMCNLEVKYLHVENPSASYLGLIRFVAEMNPWQPCLTAFGPHSGSFVLNRGSSSPDLVEGNYELVINETSQGILSVTAVGASLKK